ncbi:translation initiation factor IF-2 [Erysipelothrix rhusiopathiae]|uniref:Translation initiation factor IF-2 n=1 Tax=Erysipelothrix rhusiopathiae ATCC 19414 TaxID=525280 RepID=E7FUS8_ERYRH|nr:MULTISPECIES: translation initiation factor IF-2 [Erysipelothrix]AYV34588.1 translation initiation factor IF-2 [Erysipelothrix rhusiopathiae]EFY09644.1 translation initiation factor IF-2 [Erysipelothrix rhusiopathiae ATCC 19414]MDE8081195.1 translation initiation factor IF-2 [Erysipelothrix rhusiopathiae]MDE8257167.1 translation initiation factor IF-2 [Erysipelothrix rhusiopathiae]MDE8257723.1 translation initiation factor IF-2 [Erysipelothrix rhusiopathiae]
MSNKKRQRNNKNKQNRNNKRPAQDNFKPKDNVVISEIEYTDGITVKDLSEKINKSPAEVIKLLFMMGTMVTINTSLDDDTVQLICMEYEVEATRVEPVDELTLDDEEKDDPKTLEQRPPIVTIMGHVDHGKTTTLDTIRNTDVVADEFGGITQHIGAYQITHKGKKITFLDTPGHEAFTAMRARGASVTDIVIVVVAADDGVMPQTREAVDHARAANVPLIVAINKIDKPNINIDRVYSEFSDLGVMPEEWGGDTVFVKISAKSGEGIEELLETVLVASELEELKANPNRLAFGTVIEAKLDKSRGPVATLLVQKGTLRQGDPVVVGTTFGRVRKMVDNRGRELQEALPSMPVEIIGLSDVPIAGDSFRAFKDEKSSRAVADKRNQARILADRNQTSALSLDDLSQQIADGEIQDINVILKTDVQGSAEAVKASLERIEVGDGHDVRVNVIRATVGGITENDIMLASASNAIIIGFNIRPTAAIRKKADEEGIEIRLYNIIYKAIEAMEAAMKGMLAPVFEEKIFGQAEVREIYKVSKVGTIAGCMVTDGKMLKESGVRLMRDGVVIYEGQMASLKRFQNDAKEVSQGFDCGITIENYNDIKEGDVIESFGEIEVEQK